MRKLTKKEIILLSSIVGVLLLLYFAFKIFAVVEKQKIVNLCEKFCSFDIFVCFPEECAENGISENQLNAAFDKLSNAASEIFTNKLRELILNDEQKVFASIKSGDFFPLSKETKVMQVQKYNFDLNKATLCVVIYQNGFDMVRKDNEYLKQEYGGNLLYTFYFVKEDGCWLISEYEYDIYDND